MESSLPSIPAKRYFTIGEVSELCGVKPYVLRYWEQEFTQLKPMKRRGNRRYYQHHEVLLIRRIRELLYDQGFTISGARNRLGDTLLQGRAANAADDRDLAVPEGPDGASHDGAGMAVDGAGQGMESGSASPVDGQQAGQPPLPTGPRTPLQSLRDELLSIRQLLGG